MFNLDSIKQDIKASVNITSELCEQEIKENFNMIDICSSPIQNIIKSSIAILEGVRINLFIRGITEGNMNEEKFISKYRMYGDKKRLIEIIEKQRRSHTEIINLLCGCIIREGYINNIPISAKQINEINFLISLTSNDFYNCLRMFSCCKDKGSSYGTKNIANLEIIEVTKSKLEQFGYATTNAFTGGDVALNKQVLKHYNR